LNETHQLQVCADDMNITDIIKRDREALIYSSKEIGLEVNADKTKYMLLLATRMQLQS
jgi:hypothetical protein